MALPPPVGMICCWPKLPAVPGRQGSCSAPRWPSAREKAKNAVLEKYTDAQERLDKAAALLGRVEQLAVAGEWTPLYDLLTPYVLGM